MQAFTQVPSPGSARVRGELALLLLTVILCGLPFLGQPFHMDDNFYMDMARNVRVSPLFPNDRPYGFGGEYLGDMASHSHPPLVTYVLALLQAVFGKRPGGEWRYHAVFLVFPVLAVLSFYFLAALFVERPLWPSLMLAASPVFQVMSHNLMTDIPALAFVLAAAAAFLWAVETGRGILYAAAGVFLFSAMFTSYQAALVALLLAFYLAKKGGSRAGSAALAAPCAAMAAWLGANYVHYDRFILLGTVDYVRSRDFASLGSLATKFVALLQYQGWLVVFPLFVICFFGRSAKGRLTALLVLASIYGAQVMVPVYRLVDKAIFVVGAAAGALVVLRMAHFAGRAFACRGEGTGFGCTEGRFLALWYFGAAAVCLSLFTEGSARYVLPLVPPLLLYYFRQLEAAEVSEYRQSGRQWLRAAAVASGSVVVSLAWGLALARADAEFARVYPRLAREAARAAGGLPCYYGGEWGFRYYLEQAGCRQLPRDQSRVTGGSFIVTPRLAVPYHLPADLSSMTAPVAELPVVPDTVLRLLGGQTPAGFYSTGWGLLPFSVSGGPLETVEIRQVNYLVERLPWAEVEGGGIRPWPGDVAIGGESRPALLLEPDTRVAYGWELKVPARFEVWCGAADGARAMEACEFEVRLRDGAGETRARARAYLDAGSSGWQQLALALPAAQEGAILKLELRYTAGGGRRPVGAFADAVVRPAGP